MLISFVLQYTPGLLLKTRVSCALLTQMTVLYGMT